jgi:hypothetical protein
VTSSPPTLSVASQTPGQRRMHGDRKQQQHRLDATLNDVTTTTVAARTSRRGSGGGKHGGRGRDQTNKSKRRKGGQGAGFWSPISDPDGHGDNDDDQIEKETETVVKVVLDNDITTTNLPSTTPDDVTTVSSERQQQRLAADRNRKYTNITDARTSSSHVTAVGLPSKPCDADCADMADDIVVEGPEVDDDLAMTSRCQCDRRLCPSACRGDTPAAVIVSDPCRCCANLMTSCRQDKMTSTVTSLVPSSTAQSTVAALVRSHSLDVEEGEESDVAVVQISARAVNACTSMVCPANKVCLLNIQGLPMCRCPSIYHCRGVERRPLCSTDGATFKNRCLLKVEECATNRRIRVRHRGPCRVSSTETNHNGSGRWSTSAGVAAAAQRGREAELVMDRIPPLHSDERRRRHRQNDNKKHWRQKKMMWK